jgi:hypothetical protein
VEELEVRDLQDSELRADKLWLTCSGGRIQGETLGWRLPDGILYMEELHVK